MLKFGLKLAHLPWETILKKCLSKIYPLDNVRSLSPFDENGTKKWDNGDNQKFLPKAL